MVSPSMGDVQLLNHHVVSSRAWCDHGFSKFDRSAKDDIARNHPVSTPLCEPIGRFCVTPAIRPERHKLHLSSAVPFCRDRGTHADIDGLRA